MLSPISFKLTPLSIEDLITKITQPYALAKVLHGYWDRLSVITPKRTEIDIKNALKTICSDNRDFYKELILELPKDRENTMQLFGVLNRDIDWHYYDLIDLLKFRTDIIWAVHYEGFPETCQETNPLRKGCIEVMNCILNSTNTYYDGLIWKRACLDGTLVLLLEKIKSIPNAKVIVVGLDHLREINSNVYWQFSNYDFIKAEMPLSPKRDQFVSELIDFHNCSSGSRFYFFQLGMLTPWVICKAWHEMKDCWMFDIGKALDIFCDVKSKPYLPFAENIDWEKWDALRTK